MTESKDGTPSLTYRTPSKVFAPYPSEALHAMAIELAIVFERMAHDATQP